MQAKDGFEDAVSDALQSIEDCKQAKAALVLAAAQTDATYRLRGQVSAGICSGVLGALEEKATTETDEAKLAEIRTRCLRLRDLIAQLSEFRMMG